MVSPGRGGAGVPALRVGGPGGPRGSSRDTRPAPRGRDVARGEMCSRRGRQTLAFAVLAVG